MAASRWISGGRGQGKGSYFACLYAFVNGKYVESSIILPISNLRDSSSDLKLTFHFSDRDEMQCIEFKKKHIKKFVAYKDEDYNLVGIYVVKTKRGVKMEISIVSSPDLNWEKIDPDKYHGTRCLILNHLLDFFKELNLAKDGDLTMNPKMSSLVFNYLEFNIWLMALTQPSHDIGKIIDLIKMWNQRNIPKEMRKYLLVNLSKRICN